MVHTLVDVLGEELDAIVKLALLSIKDRESQFLLLHFFLTASLVTFKLVNSILLFLFDVVLVGDI